MDAGRAARRPRRRAAARAQSTPSLDADGVAIVASPPKPALELVVLSSSDDEEPEQHDDAVGALKKNVPAERKRRRTTPAAAAAAPTAPRKRRRRVVIAGTGASATSAEVVAVKQETDGGWPAEFQPLRALPFERSEYERLRAVFFTEYDVYAGARESQTRRGTLRVTQRVPRRTIAIAEWPRLREAVEQLHADEQPEAALAHLRCLERYMQTVQHPSVPRILRQDVGDAGGSGAVEVIDLAASSEEEEQSAVAIDVEQLEELLLGPALMLVKQELIGSENTLAGAASALPVVVFDRSHESMELSEGGACGATEDLLAKWAEQLKADRTLMELLSDDTFIEQSDEIWQILRDTHGWGSEVCDYMNWDHRWYFPPWGETPNWGRCGVHADGRNNFRDKVDCARFCWRLVDQQETQGTPQGTAAAAAAAAAPAAAPAAAAKAPAAAAPAAAAAAAKAPAAAAAAGSSRTFSSVLQAVVGAAARFARTPTANVST